MEPNFLIVGGSKCGTTNLSYHLMEHDQVFMPELNEPYYFCRLDVPDDFERDSMVWKKDEYLSLFKNAKKNQRIGEATSTYLHCPHAAQDIKNHFNNCKIIILVRNPIERAHSSYFSYKFMKFDERAFSEIINEHEKKIEMEEFFIYSVLEPGFYSKHIKRFQSIFSEEQIKIIVFEDYIKNVEKTIKSVLEFLELDSEIIFKEQKKGAYRVPKNKLSEKLLKNKMFRNTATKIIPPVYRQKLGDKLLVNQTKKPKMLEEDYRKLKSIYQNEVKELEKLLNRKLPWDDFKTN